jgi:hypothetical protein
LGGWCAKSAISAISPLLMRQLADPLPIGAVLPRQPRDKRDDLSAYELRIGERPVCHPAAVSSGLGWPRAGWCGVSLVVKTAQSRERTGRTMLNALILLSAGTPSLGAGMLRTGVIRHFDVTLRFATPKSSRGQPLMLFRWWAADARAERAGARPNRAVVARRR